MKIQQDDALTAVSSKILTCIKYLLMGKSMHSAAIQLFLDPSSIAHTEQDFKSARSQIAEIHVSLNTEIKAGLDSAKEYLRNKPGYGAIHQITRYSDLAAFGAAKRFAELIEAKKFHLAYFFCFALYNQLKNDPVYLGVFFKNLNQINKACCTQFSIYLLSLLSTKDMSGKSLLPENHEIKEQANLNGVLLWLLQDQYFTDQLVKLVETPSTFLSHDALNYFIKTFETLSAAKKIQRALPHFSNNPYMDAAYLCHLVSQSAPIHDYLNRPVRIDLLRLKATLDRLIEVKAYAPCVFFAWHYPDAIQSIEKQTLSFNKWLIRTDQAQPLMHIGFVGYELGIKKLFESVHNPFVKRGLILYDALHGQGRDKLAKEDWQIRILESKNPAKIIQSYSTALIGLTDLGFIRGMLIVDVQKLLQKIAQSHPKLIEEKQSTEFKSCKIDILIDNLNFIIPQLAKQNQKLAKTIALDLDHIKSILALIQEFKQLTEIKKSNPIQSYKYFIEEHKEINKKEIFQDISGVSRALEAEAWVINWLQDSKVQQAMRKDSNLLHEVYVLLAFIHQFLNLIPHYDSELKITGKSLSKLSGSLNMAVEFFKTLDLAKQTILLKTLLIRTNQPASERSRKIQPAFYLVANLLAILPVSADKSQVLKEIPIDKHDEFLYYFGLTPNSSSIHSDIVKKLELYANDASSADPGIFFQRIKRFEKEQRIDFPKAFEIVTQYSHSEVSPQELAEKLLQPAFNEEMIFPATKLVMALKFPLALQYLRKPTKELELDVSTMIIPDEIVDRVDQEICEELIKLGEIKHETDRQSIEDIRAQVLMMLVYPLLEREKSALFEAAQLILLHDQDHLTGTITVFVKKLLNQVFFECKKDFVEFELLFRDNLLSSEIFKKIFKKDRNLELITGLINGIYGLLSNQSLLSVFNLFNKGDCQSLVNYTLLTISPIVSDIEEGDIDKSFSSTHSRIDEDKQHLEQPLKTKLYDENSIESKAQNQRQFQRAIHIFTELAIHFQAKLDSDDTIQVKDFYDLLVKNVNYDWQTLLAVLILNLPEQGCELISKLQEQEQTGITLHFDVFKYYFINSLDYLPSGDIFDSLMGITNCLMDQYEINGMPRALACQTWIIEARLEGLNDVYLKEMLDCLLYVQSARQRLISFFAIETDRWGSENRHQEFANIFAGQDEVTQLNMIKACAKSLEHAAKEEADILTRVTDSRDSCLANLKKYIFAIYRINAIWLSIFSWQAAKESINSQRNSNLPMIAQFKYLLDIDRILRTVNSIISMAKFLCARSILMIRIANYYTNTKFYPDQKSDEDSKKFVPASIITQCLLEEKIDLISVLVYANMPLVNHNYKIFILVKLLLNCDSSIPPLNRVLPFDNIKLICKFFSLLFQSELSRDSFLKKSDHKLHYNEIPLTDYTSGIIRAIVNGCIEAKQTSLVDVIISRFGVALKKFYDLSSLKLASEIKLVACTGNILRVLKEFDDHEKWIGLFLENIPTQILDLVKPLQLQSTSHLLSQQSSQQPKNTYGLWSMFSQIRQKKPITDGLIFKK